MEAMTLVLPVFSTCCVSAFLHSITSSTIASRPIRHVEPECLRGFEVDHQLELGRLNHR
jgi:hypothetical protein